jgi:hypothetical protein
MPVSAESSSHRRGPHSQLPHALAAIGHVVEKRFAVLGNEGIEIDQRANPVRHPVGDVAHDGPAVGSSDQDDVAQVLPNHEIGNIRDMGVEADVAAQEVGAFSEACQRRREHLVPRGRQQATHAGPAPAATPRAVDQDVVGHCGELLAMSSP